MEKTTPIIYVLLNKELNMSAGKAAAQTAHAVALLSYKNDSFTSYVRRTVIVLEAENAAQIQNLHEYLKGADIYSAYYIDEGVNEVGAYSVTALAVEPIDAGDEVKRQIFESFNLFGSSCDKEECAPTNNMRESLIALRNLKYDFQHYDGLDFVDNTPRPIRKAIDWLRKHQ